MLGAVRTQFKRYQADHPQEIYDFWGGAECKLLIDEFNSERHPDLVVYKSAPPEEGDLWSTWIPDLVVEIVSKSSVRRDYEEKPEEYLKFGVREYWIIDPQKSLMTAFRRWRGKWATHAVRAPKTYRTPLFPGLVFDCGICFGAK